MRVVFDCQIFMHQAVGGISRYYASLVPHLAKNVDCDVKVRAPLHRNEYLRRLDSDLVRGFKLPSNRHTNRLVLAANTLISPLVSCLDRPDIAHETYFSARRYVLNAKRRVTTMYDMINEIFEPIPSVTHCKRMTLARCDHVICISHNTKKDLVERLNFPAERTTVVHLGFEDFASRPASATETARPQKPYFLFVGSRTGYKNFNGALRAYASSTQLKSQFALVCFGGGRLTCDELAHAHELGLDAGDVEQVSGDDTTLGALYRHAIALIYPSHYEGFGLPPLEAMSAGCPVICSNRSSIPEVVAEAGLYIDPDDIEAIRDAMERVADSSLLRKDLADRGAARCRHFSWERCAAETAAVYRRLL